MNTNEHCFFQKTPHAIKRKPNVLSNAGEYKTVFAEISWFDICSDYIATEFSRLLISVLNEIFFFFWRFLGVTGQCFDFITMCFIQPVNKCSSRNPFRLFNVEFIYCFKRLTSNRTNYFVNVSVLPVSPCY